MPERIHLRALGARIDSRAILHDVRFFNLYRTGFPGLRIGDRCFLGEQCLLDLADVPSLLQTAQVHDPDPSTRDHMAGGLARLTALHPALSSR